MPARSDDVPFNRFCTECNGLIPPAKNMAAKLCSEACRKAERSRLRRVEADGRRALEGCLVCDAPLGRARNARNKYCSDACRNEANSLASVRRKYGLSRKGYEALLESQGNACAICGTTEWPGRWGKPHVDHDHVTGRVRSLLCYGCNQGLGSFRDDPDTLEKAAAYIRHHSTRGDQDDPRKPVGGDRN